MRYFLNICVVGIVALFINGCGGGGSGTITSLNINYLEDGYDVKFVNNSNEGYTAKFCQNRIKYINEDSSMEIDRLFDISDPYINTRSLSNTDFAYWDISVPHASILEVGIKYDIYDTLNVIIGNALIISIKKVNCP